MSCLKLSVGLPSLLLFVAITTSFAAVTGPSPNCKSIPGDEAYPGLDKWASLNVNVQGRLIATVPTASVCHDQPFHDFDADECATVLAGWNGPLLHFASPSEIMPPFFQNQSCDPYTPRAKPCELGNYPSYSINVTGPEDVIAGIEFAKANNIRLVTKNTGHDPMAKGVGKGALALWTHNLKDMQVHANYAGPTYTGPALKMGAGVQVFEADEIADKFGFRVVGGDCPTVGIAGGYTMGGGHSQLNGLYGLGADNVLEWEVVTTGGHHLVASPTSHPDLFWAMCGGGPFYAIALSVTVKLHPDGPIGTAKLSFNDSAVGGDVYWDAVEAIHAVLPGAFLDLGHTFFYSIGNNSFAVSSVTAAGVSAAGVADLLAPILAELSSRNIPFSFSTGQTDSYFAHFVADFGPLPQGVFGGSVVGSSRLIPRAAVTNPTRNQALTKVLRDIVWDGELHLLMVAMNASAFPVPDNAVLPAWRNAVIHAIYASTWDWTIPRTDMLARQDRLTKDLDPAFKAVTPDSGTYMNEANFQEPDFKTQFYGANYARLAAIKQNYDPDGLIYGVTGVGSDDFVVDGEGRLCKVA